MVVHHQGSQHYKSILILEPSGFGVTITTFPLGLILSEQVEYPSMSSWSHVSSPSDWVYSRPSSSSENLVPVGHPLFGFVRHKVQGTASNVRFSGPGSGSDGCRWPYSFLDRPVYLYLSSYKSHSADYRESKRKLPVMSCVPPSGLSDLDSLTSGISQGTECFGWLYSRRSHSASLWRSASQSFASLKLKVLETSFYLLEPQLS